MPRYFPSHRHKSLNNHKGIDLSGNAARDSAGARTRPQTPRSHAVHWTGWFVAIVDQHGHKVADRERLSKAMSANDPKRTPRGHAIASQTTPQKPHSASKREACEKRRC